MSVMEETLLWKYIDGDCTPQELALVEKMLAEEERIRQHFNTMKLLHGDLLNLEMQQPSMRFTANVMEQLPVLKGTQLLASRWVLLTALFLATVPFLALLFKIPVGINTEELPSQWVEWAESTQSLMLAQNWTSVLSWIVPITALVFLFFVDRIYQQTEEQKYITG
ncbi:MAG: hypothetical protein AAGH79_06640 [Bacteroidota bacterium]